MATSPASCRVGLEGIPPELLGNLVDDLDRPSICNLRLASRYFRTFTYHRFRRFFVQRRTDLTWDSLVRLGQIAADPDFGSAVRSLMVMATVCDGSRWERILSKKKQRVSNKQRKATAEKLIEARTMQDKLVSVAKNQQQMSSDETDLELLAAALRRFRSLPSLQVEGAVYDGTTGYKAASKMQKWHLVFLRAAQVHRTVMLAIARGGVAIEKLHIYQTSRRCSVPTWEINELMPKLDSTAFADAGRNIKTLSLSLSTSFESEDQSITEMIENLSDIERVYYDASMSSDAGYLLDDGPSYWAEGNYIGVARLLQHLPSIETLKLHLYDTLKFEKNNYAKILAHIADTVHLPALRHVTFGGLPCTSSSLVAFLQAHETSIQVLNLRQIDLVDASWRTVFDHLCTMPNLQKVRLHTLEGTENGRLLHLAPRSRPSRRGSLSNPQYELYWEGLDDDSQSFPCLDKNHMFARNFTREEFLREKFQFAEGPKQRAMGSAAATRWRESRRREFGPP